MAVLIVEKGPDRGQKFMFSGAEIVVGRGTKLVAKLSDTLISREHFRISSKDGRFYIEDLGSLNGTALNGQNISAVIQLTDGDEISIGETSMSWLEKEQSLDKDPLLNQKLAGYLILERLGRGGMGTVYRARQLSLQRDVAIKILNQRLGQDNNFIKRFIEEARASANLNHPNILQVHDVGEENGRYYFSMEFAAGGSIQQLIEGGKALTVPEAVRYMLDTARGLEYAERKKIVHRDIKPDNLMLSEEKMVKIGDLGLAKRIGQKSSEEKREQVFGTPHFISPEQAKGEAVDHRADIYSFGATFYRIFSGRTPFQGENIRALIIKHIMEEPPALQIVSPNVPEPLCRIIMQMMQKEPDKRYASNSDIISDIEAWQKKPDSSVRKKNGLNTTRALSRTAALRRDTMRRTGTLKKEAPNRPDSQRMKAARKSNPLFYVLPVTALVGFFLLLILGNAKPVNTPYTPDTPPIKNGKPTPEPHKTPDVPDKPPLTQMENESEMRAEAVYLKAKKSEKMGDHRDALQKYDRLVIEYSRSKAAEKAREDIDRLRQAMGERVREKIAEMNQDLAQKKFVRALEICSKLQQDCQGIGWLEEETTAPQKNLEDTILLEMATYQSVLQVNLQNGQFQEAQKKLAWLEQLTKSVHTSFQSRLQRELDNWQNAIQRAQENDAPQKELVQQYQKIVQNVMQTYLFQKAVDELKPLLVRARGVDAQEELKRLICELPRLEQLWQQTDGRIKSGECTVMQHMLRDTLQKMPWWKDDREVKLTGIKDGKLGLKIRLPGPGVVTIEHSVPLSQFEPLWLYQNLLAMNEKSSAEMSLNVSLYCYYQKLYAQSWDACQKASQSEGEQQLASDLQKRLEAVETSAQGKYEAIAREYKKLQKMRANKTVDRAFLQKTVQALQESLEKYRDEYGETRFFKQTNKGK
jgi:serine/threonine-protein kinase